MIQNVQINQVKANPNNPRIIKDDKFAKLVKSITDFPQMLNLRPIVVNDDMVVLGGNMRLKACKEAGLKEIPIIKASELTDEQQKEFIVKDNVGYGEWNWDDLANNWDAEELENWGLDIPNFNTNINLDEFFEDSKIDSKLPTGKIILEYTLEECDKVKSELLKHGNTPEEAIYNLLGL
jgi:ParB-like chromosome segregation protein Spo0J